MSTVQQRILIADTETTGFGPLAEIVQLAFIEVDEHLNELDRFSARVRPRVNIHPGATAVHGITNEMAAQEPYIEEILAECFSPDHFDNVYLLAHNCKFDEGYLNHYWTITGRTCTVEAARRMYPGAPNHKLQTLRDYLDIEIDDAVAHSADGDVAVLLAVLRRMVEDHGGTFEEFLDHLDEPRILETMPFGKYKGLRFEDLPDDYVGWLLSLPDLDRDMQFTLSLLE